MKITRSALVGTLAALVLTAAGLGSAEAQNNQTFRFTVSYQTDLTNYLQADEFLDPVRTMFQLNCPPVFGGSSSPLCDPAFIGFYQDLFTVGVIDGINLAIAHFFPGQIMRCGDQISAVSDDTEADILALDPRLRGGTGAASIVVQNALARCTIGP